MKKAIVWLAGSCLIALGLVLSIRYFDAGLIRHYLMELVRQPVLCLGMLAAYLLAFVLRAWAWKLYANRALPFKIFLSGLFYSLLINHIVPVKAGDGLRVYVLVREKTDFGEAVHSTVVMRTLDMLVLAFFACAGAALIGYAYPPAFILTAAASGLALLALLFALHRMGKLGWLNKHAVLLMNALKGKKGLLILSLIAISWILEAVVVIGVVQTLERQLGIVQAVWVNSMTIAGQAFQMTPGGIGSYESVMSFSLVQAGFTWDQAYAAALVTHGFKFGFSYLAGFYVWLTYPLGWKEIKKYMNRKGKAADEKSFTV